MRDAFIPSGAVVLVHKHPYRASAETPYESGQIVCFSYKDSPDQLRVLYLKDDSVVLVAASPDISAFPPVVCTKSDLSDGTLQIKVLPQGSSSICKNLYYMYILHISAPTVNRRRIWYAGHILMLSVQRRVFSYKKQALMLLYFLLPVCQFHTADCRFAKR